MIDPTRHFGQSARSKAWPDGFTFYHEPGLPVSEDQTKEIAASLDVAADSEHVAADSEHVAATIAALRRFDGRERAMAYGTRFRLIDMEESNLNGYELTCLDTGYVIVGEDKDQYVKLVIFDHDGVRSNVPVSNCEVVRDHRIGDHRTRDLETLAALAQAMDGLNANVLASLARHGAELGLQGEPEQIAAAAREAAVEMEQSRRPRRGRYPLTSRAILFQELAAIYETTTGQCATISTTSGSGRTKGGQPSGPFFCFLRAGVAPVPSLNALKDHALAKAVKLPLSASE